MKWFQGAIPPAIQKHRSESILLLVFIKGSDEASTQLQQVLDEAEVEILCEPCVALSLEASSTECAQFSQIYPVVCVPSVFCISKDGVPIEVLGGALDRAQIVSKLSKAAETHRKQISSSQAVRDNAAATSSVSDSATATSAISDSATNSSVSDGAAASPQLRDHAASSNAPQVENNLLETSSVQEGGMSREAGQDLEERVSRAMKKMEEKREERAQAEKQKQRDTELTRRQQGRDAARLQEWQREHEAKLAVQERQREKREEKEARERVRAQIARDREEKNARFAAEKKARMDEREARKAEQQKAENEARAQAAEVRSQTARLQFRFSDGSSRTENFASSQTLQDAADFVKQVHSLPFVLSTAFPRRLFTQTDMTSTLGDLGLAPSAVLLVLSNAPQQHSSTSADAGLLSWLLAPLLFLWRILTGLFSTAPQPRPLPSQQTDTPPSSTAGLRRRQPRRLGDLSGDDDEAATWNGNSTQQL